MNIESLLNKINLFEELVILSGFKRNLSDFIQAIQQPQNQNLIYMGGISQKVKQSLESFENNSITSELQSVLRDNIPFSNIGTLEKLQTLDDDNEIAGDSYFQEINGILGKLLNAINTNENEIVPVKQMLLRYVTDKSGYRTEHDQGLVSIILKDLESTGCLKEFSKVLLRWNRTLLIYHGLVKSVSPEKIPIVEIQNGSLDVILNIDIDVAMDLTELVKTGVQVYAAYLLYKTKTAKKIIESYVGNKELIKGEKSREKLMLSNIKDSIRNKATEQHLDRLKTDKKIVKTSVKKSVDEISNVITDHIIKGNEVRLLSSPKAQNEDGEDEIEEEDKFRKLSRELRQETAIAREHYKKLSDKDRTLLISKYSIKDNEHPPKKKSAAIKNPKPKK